MSDQELRDKLASEGMTSELTGELIPRWHQADFKAGWDAARANDIDYKKNAQEYSLELLYTQQERDQLKDRLQWSLRNEEKYKAALDESFKRENELRAEVERLKGINLEYRKQLEDNEWKVEANLRAEVERLRGNAKTLRKEGSDAKRENADAKEDLVQLQAAAEKLAEALEEYGVHKTNCAWMDHPDRPCTCGYDKALAEYRAKYPKIK